MLDQNCMVSMNLPLFLLLIRTHCMCTLPNLNSLNFEVSPVFDLRVTPTNEDCMVELLSCKVRPEHWKLHHGTTLGKSPQCPWWWIFSWVPLWRWEQRMCECSKLSFKVVITETNACFTDCENLINVIYLYYYTLKLYSHR